MTAMRRCRSKRRWGQQKIRRVATAEDQMRGPNLENFQRRMSAYARRQTAQPERKRPAMRKMKTKTVRGVRIEADDLVIALIDRLIKTATLMASIRPNR